MFNETRRYDHIYDPVYIKTSGNRPLFRSDKTVNTSTILGQQRCKYFAQSNRQYATASNVFLDAEYLKSPTSTHLQSPNNSKVSTAIKMSDKVSSRSFPKSPSFMNSEPFSKTIGIQTDYRDTSIQTDPYSPPFEIIPDKNGNKNAPLLAAKHLKFADGTLPAGYDEIEALEREVIKRQILAALPKTNDKKSLKLRRSILSQIEASDWEYKETLIKREQHEKYLNVVAEMKKRDEMMEKLEEERLNKLRMTLYAQQQQFDEKMEQKRIKALRKISTKHNMIKNVMNNISQSGPNSKNKTKMIGKYYNYNSELYAPIKRKGNVHQNSTKQLLQTVASNDLEIKNKAIQRLSIGIQHEMNNNQQQTYSISDTIKLETKKYATRSGQKILQQLNRMNTLLKATYDDDGRRNNDSNVEQMSKRFENIYKTFNPVVRPQTPSLDEDAFDAETMDNANNIKLLQSMFRGRAVQNKMFQGMQKKLALIKELQINECVDDITQEKKEKTTNFLSELAPFVMNELSII